MEIKILGAHKLESRDTRHTCFLIDDVLGVDAGSLATALSLEELSRIEAILISHQHFDHIRDLPTVGLATLGEQRQIGLYSLPETLAKIHTHFFDDSIWPDLTVPLNDIPPRFQLNHMKPGIVASVLTYQVTPIEVSHPVPCIGFVIKSPTGSSMAYTGDTDDLRPFIKDFDDLDVMFVDVSFPNRMAELAELTGHLTPKKLHEQLVFFQPKPGQPGSGRHGVGGWPKIVAVHLNPEDKAEVAEELDIVCQELAIDISVGKEDTIISI